VRGLGRNPPRHDRRAGLSPLLGGNSAGERVRGRDPRKLTPPLHGALLKNEQDVSLFEKLAFIARREGR